MKHTKEFLEENLLVGTKIKIGSKYVQETGCGFREGEIIELVNGYFEYDNGLYTETEECPSYYDSYSNDYVSIYHLFGNDLEEFLDCEIL